MTKECDDTKEKIKNLFRDETYKDEEKQRKATRQAQKTLTEAIIREAEVLAKSSWAAREDAGMTLPGPDEWARRWLDFVHAREFIHLAMMIPGTNLHGAPHCVRTMMRHPMTDEPATTKELIMWWRMTEPLGEYRISWWDDSKETGLDVAEMGQVHEAIMNVIGACPEKDAVEIAKGGKRENGVFLAYEPLGDWEEKSLVLDKDKKPFRHPAGVFCIIPGGKHRERSASFYTPKALADFTVEQGLDVTAEERQDMRAEDWLTLSVLEPSVGTGAIAIPAVRLIAERYLTLRQEELGREVPAEDYLVELQKVKQHVVMNQLHAVDLNPGSLKILELSVWVESLIPEKVAVPA